MTLARVLSLTLLVGLLGSGGPDKNDFDLKVTRVRTLRNQPGDLHADPEAVTFRSADGKTTIRIAMQDLREADVADAQALRFETYQVQKWKPMERLMYTFRAQPDAPVEELARFLAARVHRPVVGHYADVSQFEVPAYHRRLRTGTGGMLQIGQDSIQFVSGKASDSRTWLYRDIETIGRPDPFRFRVTTNRQTYVLELKAELPETAYRFAWSKVYGSEGRGR